VSHLPLRPDGLPVDVQVGSRNARHILRGR